MSVETTLAGGGLGRGSRTPAESAVLRRALELDRGDHGIYPKGGPQTALFRRLVDRGLMLHEGLGSCLDREGEAEIYVLTAAGRDAAKNL